jgi:hypothetical protein
MRNESHSWISILSEEVEAWRRHEGWSRETVVQQFVDAWNEAGMGSTWGVEWSANVDGFQRQKNNADKVYRWLNDVEKDSNLLTANFAKVILATLPVSYRVRATSRMLASIGLRVNLLDDTQEEEVSLSHIFAAQIDSTNAMHHATIALQNPTPENLEAAEIHLQQAIVKQKFLGRMFGSLRTKATKAKETTKAVINKAFHRKASI